MAIIDDIGYPDSNPTAQNFYRQEFWKKYDEHKDDVVLSIGFLFFKRSVRLRQLRGVFVWLFGPHPETSIYPGR
jgi:hypothetical protein